MYTCVICYFTAELDDVIAPTATGRCVCLRCYTRETDTSRPMPKALQRDVNLALSEAAGAA